MLTFLILQRIRYGPKPSHIGIGKLLNRGAYGAAFPLHDGPKDPDYVEKSLPIRNKLWSQWSEMKNIFKFQPLDTIRGYFGEKIGLCTYIPTYKKFCSNNFVDSAFNTYPPTFLLSLLLCVAWILHNMVNFPDDPRSHNILLRHW